MIHLTTKIQRVIDSRINRGYVSLIDAEDILQEVTMELLKKLPVYAAHLSDEKGQWKLAKRLVDRFARRLSRARTRCWVVDPAKFSDIQYDDDPSIQIRIEEIESTFSSEEKLLAELSWQVNSDKIDKKAAREEFEETFDCSQSGYYRRRKEFLTRVEKLADSSGQTIESETNAEQTIPTSAANE